MKKSIFFLTGLVMSVLITNCSAVVRDGRRLDELRNSVLRLHILAESDSSRDQNLKLKVRDALLESNIFGNADSLDSAEKIAQEKLSEIVDIAESTLLENGCNSPVTAEIADVVFDKRVYGDITMPAGEYRALRVKIGSAEGKNWWCVMYPPLCIPAACDVEENKQAEEVFSENELDIMYHPEKYEVRFAIWDKIKEIFGK